MNVTIHEYAKRMGQNPNQFSNFKASLKPAINEKLHSFDGSTIDVYYLEGSKYDFRGGSDTRFCIYGNASHTSAEGEKYGIEEGEVVGEYSYLFTELLPFNPSHTLITTPKGTVLAEYHKEHNELYVLIDLFHTYHVENVALFSYIMERVNELVFIPKQYANSWAHTHDRDALTNSFTESLKRARSSQIEQDKRSLSSHEHQIDEYKRYLKQAWDNVLRLRNSIERDEESLSGVSTKLIADLDNIIAHPKVSDLIITDGKFIVKVPNVYAYNKNDERFYIGNMRIELQPERADVRFYNENNPRQGYWSEHDPHPHVNGREGAHNACLGNTEATIAELSSRMELYALVMICIDFLENANIDDPAGRRVYNWDMVDEEGNVIREGGRPTEECYDCDDHYESDRMNDAYDYVDDDGDAIDHRRVCDACLEEYYTYDDDAEVYVRD